jgi:hypothetical protein
MLLTLAKLHVDASPGVWGHRLVVVATLAGWLALAALIASLYVGHAPSPYGMCTTPSGRSVACAMLKRSSLPR